MSRPAERPPTPYSRLGPRHADWVRDRLSSRDLKIMDSVARLGVLSADQLERLHFASLTGRSRQVVRGRVLRRLATWRVLAPLGRRVGGTRRGSARTVYALDTIGQRLVAERRAAEQPTVRVRRPHPPGDRFLAHALAVSELHVAVATNAARAGMALETFDAEPAAWWPDGFRGWLKPDAYVRLSTPAFDDHWWVEVDRATESLPTLTRKLTAYLDFWQRGQLGPNGVMPRVLISTITEARQHAIRDLVARLPEPADGLFVVTLDRDAWLALLGSFKE